MDGNLVKWKTSLKMFFSGYQNHDAKEILDAAQQIDTIPTLHLKKIVSDSIEQAGNGVAQYIFGNHTEPAKWGEDYFSNYRDELAVGVISWTISQVSSFNFNETVYGSKAYDKWTHQMADKAGLEASRSVLLEYLIQSHKFEKYLANKPYWSKTLMDLLMNPTFINGVIVEELTPYETSMLVIMPYTFLYFLNKESYQKAMDFFKDHVKNKSLVPDTADYIDRNYFETIIPLLKDTFAGSVSKACNKKETEIFDLAIPESAYIPYACYYYLNTYGGDVVTWLNSQNGPKLYALRSSSKSKNTTITSPDSPFGCFIGDTKVQLYDGQSEEICRLQQGDIVLCGDGSKGLVSAESVRHQSDHEFTLFGFNEEKPFFTSSHPFWTPKGWKAINAELAKAENPWLLVGTLKEGDSVRKLVTNKEGTLEHSWVTIQKIQPETFPAGTPIHGLHITEGHRSYHANGYIVHLNYPEITVDRIQKGILNLPGKDQDVVHDALSTLQPYIHRILGPGSGQAIQNLLESKSVGDRMVKPRVQNTQHIAHVTITDLKIRYKTYTVDEDSRYPSVIDLVNGHLFVDGEVVENTHFINDATIYWYRCVRENRYEHGCLKFSSNRLCAYGCLYSTETMDSNELKTTTPFIASTVNKYACTKSVCPISKDNPNPEMETFGELEMGFIIDKKGDPKPFGQITLENTVLDPKTATVGFFVNDKMRLNVKVEVDPNAATTLMFIRLKGQFNFDFTSFVGDAIAYDADGDGFEGAHYLWRGKIIPSERAAVLKRKASMLHHKMEHPVSSASQLKQPVTSPMMLAMVDKMEQQTLSVVELINLPTPDKGALSQLSLGKLVTLAKYTMSDDVLNNIFGIVRPTIREDMRKVAEEHKDFLQNRFANAYILTALKDQVELKDKFSEDEKRKLEWYLKPTKSDKGINAEKGFHPVNQEVARLAFLEECPDLQKYISSPEGGEYWAKKMYDYMTTATFLNGLVVEELLPNAQAIIQKYTTTLYCLAPEKNFAIQFQKKLTAYSINKINKSFAGSNKDKDDMIHIMGETLRSLLNEIWQGTDKLSPEIRKSFMDEINELAKKQRVTAEELFQNMMTRIDEVANTVIGSLLSSKGPFFKRMFEAMKECRTKFARIVGKGAELFLNKLLPLTLWTFSAVFCVLQFLQYKSLSPVQQAALIATTATIGFQLLSKMPDYLSRMAELFRNYISRASVATEIEILETFQSFTTAERVESGIVVITEEAANSLGRTTEELISEGISASNIAEDVWDFARITKGIAKVMNVLGLVLSSVAMGISVINDFKEGKSVLQKTLDILQLVSGVVELGAFIGAEFLSIAVCPVIGIVAAVVGIVLTIISLFTQKQKAQQTPAEKYIDDHGRKFMDALPSPPADWDSKKVPEKAELQKMLVKIRSDDLTVEIQV